MNLRCIVCRDDVGTRSEDGLISMRGGTVWSTGGNYGSTLFDMCPGTLQAFICDSCLKERESMVSTVFERTKTTLVVLPGIVVGDNGDEEDEEDG